MTGKERPDYARAVDLPAKAAIRRDDYPFTLLPVLAPIVVYSGVLLISRLRRLRPSLPRAAAPSLLRRYHQWAFRGGFH